MKVVYVFALPRSAGYKLGQMILRQREAGIHGVSAPGPSCRCSAQASTIPPNA
jgi:hypothetical protein